MFRQKYLDHVEIADQLAQWAKRHPGIAHVNTNPAIGGQWSVIG